MTYFVDPHWSTLSAWLIVRWVTVSPHDRHRFQNLSFLLIFEWILYCQNIHGFDSSLQEWFTLCRLIDNTIVAMEWVTHGFRCSNHETWVITESDTHFLLFIFDNWPTFFRQKYRQYNWHWRESLLGWISPFHRRNSREINAVLVARFADHHPAAAAANHRHLPPPPCERGLQLPIFPLIVVVVYGFAASSPLSTPLNAWPSFLLPCPATNTECVLLW